MALEWRPAHFSVGFDGYDDRGLFVAQVVRYADIDHEHRHAVRGHFWRPFLHGVDLVQPGGFYETPEAAMAAANPRSTLDGMGPQSVRLSLTVPAPTMGDVHARAQRRLQVDER